MSIADTPSRRQALSDYHQGVERLAKALEDVWRACDQVDGLNLPESLSVALGTAAKRLAKGTLTHDADGGPDKDDSGFLYERAGDLLVKHRPGSWEAEHVRRLVFPPELIPDPT